ncbi:hypothetical protein NQ317_013477 [Molorchus minor]|uniref:Signal recognition particle 14 kDa protein n=1 Tax=Molorchus minor TaxID=1323400 RepID=A0ABQ9JFM5_9CUCU|nr:hypothetical protein NQ317_013477 [Molorchus minor]
MVLLENDSFLSELTKFFQKARLNGSVTMTFKRYDGRDRPIPRPDKPPDKLPEPHEHMCLVKAKFRSKKISTVIHQKDINKFQVAYSSLLKRQPGRIEEIKET